MFDRMDRIHAETNRRFDTMQAGLSPAQVIDTPTTPFPMPSVNRRPARSFPTEPRG